MKWHHHLASRIATSWMKLMGGEAAAGLLLVAVAIAAMAVANSPLSGLHHALFDGPLPWTPVAKLATFNLWIDDGLMAVFFFVVGLEIKRELLDGELAGPARRRLPVLAALAGMAAPALVYLAVAGAGGPLARGWAIPAATDIAFALGVLAIAGKGLPPSLRLFLLAVAVVDDLGAVAIIALFYTAKVKLAWLAGGAAMLAAMVAANRLGARRALLFVPLAVALWYCVLHSGVHATIAGVLAALTIPMRLGRSHDCLLLRLEHALTPWNGYVIVPLFGFANAGVSLDGAGLSALFQPLPLAIAAGLVLGKQLGVFGAVFLAERAGFAPRPKGASWLHVWGISALCGVGFTMSLFIGALAFPGQPAQYDQAKLGVLAGSLVAIVLAAAILRLGARPKED